MGLDTFAVQNIREGEDQYPPPDQEQKKAFAGITLIGGMFSGNGAEASFRGKAYDPLVVKACGEEFSLYQELIDNDDVGLMANRLEKFLTDWPEGEDFEVDDQYLGTIPYSREEAENLARFMRATYDQGLVLYGWW